MLPDVTIEFDPFCPVHVATLEQVRTAFGKLYKYDFPKWCVEHNLRCFYNPATLVYVVIPKELQEL